jgi:uncharacterized protein (TIGR00266 family)
VSTLAYEILESPEFALLRVELTAGQRVFAEPAAMAGMAPDIELKAGLKGGLLGSVGRMFAGESMIVNTFRAPQGGEVLLAPAAPGDIVHCALNGGRLLLQRGAYLANGEGVELSASWAGARGFFSGQGLVLLQAQGTGDIFFNAYGAVLQVDVTHEYVVDTGYVVAFEDTLQYQVTTVPGLGIGRTAKTFFFGGEGLVVKFSGQGRVWLQTRTINPFLTWLYPYRPVKKRD